MLAWLILLRLYLVPEKILRKRKNISKNDFFSYLIYYRKYERKFNIKN